MINSIYNIETSKELIKIIGALLTKEEGLSNNEIMKLLNKDNHTLISHQVKSLVQQGFVKQHKHGTFTISIVDKKKLESFLLKKIRNQLDSIEGANPKIKEIILDPKHLELALTKNLIPFNKDITLEGVISNYITFVVISILQLK